MSRSALDECLSRLSSGPVMFVRRFLSRLYRDYPQFRMLFGDIDRVSQERALVAAIEQLTSVHADQAALTRWLETQAACLERCGVEPSDYADLGAAILLTLAESEGSCWTEEAASACREILGVLKAMAQSPAA